MSELKMATFAVADKGHGITPEDKPRLFEPNFSTKKSGTGLGLAIVSSVVSDHQRFCPGQGQPAAGRLLYRGTAGGIEGLPPAFGFIATSLAESLII